MKKLKMCSKLDHCDLRQIEKKKETNLHCPASGNIELFRNNFNKICPL